MTILSAETSFRVEGARAVMDDVCDHLRSHFVDVDKRPDHTILSFSSYYGTCKFTVDGDDTTITIQSRTQTGIAIVKEEMTSHLIEHSPGLADKIVWSGAGSELSSPAWFSLITVADVRPLTPHMRRITFLASDSGAYADFGHIHLRLFFPQLDDRPPEWPTVTPSGLTQYPPDTSLAIRKYTCRDVDVAAGTIDIDFVLHEDAGPGSDFALRAKPGDVIGMAGPGGLSARLDRDWYLLAGDETALPAIARILETLPGTARGVALIEVADAAEEQAIETKGKFDIRWLHRNGAAAGTTTLLIDALRTVEFPADGSSVFVWAGCEFAAFKAIRSHVRSDRKLPNKDTLVVSYWRRNGIDNPPTSVEVE